MASSTIMLPRRYDDIISVNLGRNGGQFKVRVLKKWIVADVLKPGRIVSVEMILIDRNGHRIQASIPEVLCPKFDSKIVEEKIYVMSNFSVRSNMGQLLASFHRNVLVFNANTEVTLSWGYNFPSHGVSLIGSNNVLSLKEMFQYLVDVIGVVTYIRHDKNIFIDGTSTKTVTLKLTDNSNSFECELSGQFVDLFREMMKDNGLGLPIVVLQWAKVIKSQGRNVVQNVDGITKLYINPTFFEAKKFKKGLVLALNRKRKTLGVCRTDKPVGFNYTTHFHCKTISQLREDPALGIYVINARLMDIVALDSWWYPVCGCDLIIEDYLGAFFCGKCRATDFEPMLKYRVKIVVEDESGSTFLEAFDHVMLPIAVIDPRKPGISRKFFPRAFDSVMGKSIMFIVEKKKHAAQYCDGMLELLCVSDDPEIIKFYVDKGFATTPSKEVSKIVDKERDLMKPIAYDSPLTTTNKLLAEYLNPTDATSQQLEAGESFGAAASNPANHDASLRSVRPRLT